ncbi:MAG TPA: molybdopterin biosynthesis protein [Bradyrhizobium sp.]|jgi:putative molybdopterin biosynthesis protein|nr:molybdopterin biosynthesis protein [Bradyrhizobium sp.]
MNDIPTALRNLARQEQFLEVVDRDEATARFQQHLKMRPLGAETIPLSEALGRILACAVIADVDVPGFDRSSVDGFAVRANDTTGASERQPKPLVLNAEILTPGTVPAIPVLPGTATLIATGGMVPRGADAVVMVEHTDTRDQGSTTVIDVRRAVVSGQFIAFAGSDLARGETVLRARQVLTSREIGMLAAVGTAAVAVWRRPRVAIISTGDEIVAPGKPIRPGAVYDSNAAIIAAAVEEAGGFPKPLGIGPDDEIVLSRLVDEGLASADMVIMSGGTSKGAGDLCYRAIALFKDPGIVVHGVALKPGKPLCLAVTSGKPVVILPGFPTSAIFTFHEFVAPVIRTFAGRPADHAERMRAVLPVRVSSERGRTEFLLVSLVRGADGSSLTAYPAGKGSGAVTAFSQADGFITIEQHAESVAAGTPVEVQLIGEAHLADLVVIGSHCVGLDVLISRLQAEGISVKALNVGSTGGLAAAKRGECDIAPIHLLDPDSGEYNRPFLTPELELVGGYRRLQGILYRKGDARFEGRSLDEAITVALTAPDCLMVNRNAGSGTRILTERLLNDARPAGYWSQPKSHNAVAVAVAQNRADWGMAIESVARQYGLGFIPAQDEHYDFAVPKSRWDSPAVQHFRKALADISVREALQAMGFRL